MGDDILKKKILYITGARSDYGIIGSVLKEMVAHNLQVEILALGMHLMPEFGMTLNDVKKSGLSVHVVNTTYEKDDRASMSKFIGESIVGITKKVSQIKPDIILVLGDRGEILASAVARAYLGIPVAHIHGGEVSETVDEYARHAISKLSNIHFPSTEKSKERLIRLGEREKYIFCVGAPGLDDLLSSKILPDEAIYKKYNLDESRPIIVATMHPVSEDIQNAPRQIETMLEALKGHQTILIYPNADAGGREMIKVIERYKSTEGFHIHKSIPREDFFNILRLASAVVGNSSGGIIEACSFHLPVVNIGNRQNGREREVNVIDVGYNTEDIRKAIHNALGDNIKELLAQVKNPYGNGTAGKQIAKILAEIEINEELLHKKITY
jgi:UDP-hydrolysing UDP-N-acetyl-D-glucosamine 2-epimerase